MNLVHLSETHKRLHQDDSSSSSSSGGGGNGGSGVVYDPCGVSVTCVSPGPTATKFAEMAHCPTGLIFNLPLLCESPENVAKDTVGSMIAGKSSANVVRESTPKPKSNQTV